MRSRSKPQSEQTPHRFTSHPSDYEKKQAARKQRLLERADKAERRSILAEDTADKLASCIPMGQPILVGHHSERRHRRDINKIHRLSDKAHEERKKYRELRSRATAVGTGGISSDDPQAIEKLEHKLCGLAEHHECMKAVNIAWRKAGRPAPDSAKGWAYIAETTGLSSTEAQELRLQLARNGGGIPYRSYALRNSGAEQRRVQARIEELHRAETASKLEEDHGFFRLVEHPEDNRVRLVFERKPEADVRTLLKRYGFRWSPRAGAWQRHLNSAGRSAARSVLNQLQQRAIHG